MISANSDPLSKFLTLRNQEIMQSNVEWKFVLGMAEFSDCGAGLSGRKLGRQPAHLGEEGFM